MIKTILWDVDRTLLDFDAAERAAIQSLFVEFGLGECSDEQVARYSVLNMKYWEKLERGEITQTQAADRLNMPLSTFRYRLNKCKK